MTEPASSSIDPAPNTSPNVLYDPTTVGIATLLGSPLAGCAIMALNYSRLNRSKEAVWTAVVGVVGTALLVAAGFFLPASVSGTGLSIGALVATVVAARKSQGPLVEAHQQSGGKVGSRWFGAGIGLLSLAIIVGLIFVWVLTNPDIPGTRLAVGQHDEIYYSGTATEDEAHRLAIALKNDGFLQDRGVTIQLHKDDQETTLTFTVNEGVWNDPKMIAGFEKIARDVASAIGGFPIKLRLLTVAGDEKKIWSVGE